MILGGSYVASQNISTNTTFCQFVVSLPPDFETFFYDSNIPYSQCL